MEIFFHRFHVPALFIANPWMMALMANGSLTGLVIHSSDTALCIAPIANVRLVEEAVVIIPATSSDLLSEQGRDTLITVRRSRARCAFCKSLCVVLLLSKCRKGLSRYALTTYLCLQGIMTCLEACPRNLWTELLDRVIPSGSFPEDFLTVLHTRITSAIAATFVSVARGVRLLFVCVCVCACVPTYTPWP